MPLLFSISSVKPKFSLNFKWPNYNCLGIHSCQKFFSAAVPLLENPTPPPSPRQNFPCPLGFCWKPAVAKNCRLIEFSSSSAILYATKYFITAFWARKREIDTEEKERRWQPHLTSAPKCPVLQTPRKMENQSRKSKGGNFVGPFYATDFLFVRVVKLIFNLILNK